MKQPEGDAELLFCGTRRGAPRVGSVVSQVSLFDEATSVLIPRERAPLIYVVDDDPACCDSLQWLLESAGYRIVTYASAERFLAEYRPGAAACLLLDVRLPGMSGLDLQQELNRRGESLPVIFISAHGGAAVAAEAMRHGAFQFLEKPVPEAQLLWAIEQTVVRDNSVGPAAGDP